MVLSDNIYSPSNFTPKNAFIWEYLSICRQEITFQLWQSDFLMDCHRIPFWVATGSVLLGLFSGVVHELFMISITSINYESNLLTTLCTCLFSWNSMKFQDLLGMEVKISFICFSLKYRTLYGEGFFCVLNLQGRNYNRECSCIIFLILYDLVFW